MIWDEAWARHSLKSLIGDVLCQQKWPRPSDVEVVRRAGDSNFVAVIRFSFLDEPQIIDIDDHPDLLNPEMLRAQIKRMTKRIALGAGTIAII